MKDYKLINVRIFHPASKTVKQRCEFTYCSNSENCAMYKDKQCVHDYRYFAHTSCPYGRYRQEEGFTHRAKNFYSWMSKRREQYADVVDAVTFNTDKMAVIGEYVYLPYPYLKNYVNQIEGIINEHFIRLDEFTVEKIDEILKFRPRALMGGEIQDFQKKHKLKFIQHLKETMPEKYEEYLLSYPEQANAFSNAVTNYVGRKAYANTLAVGAVFPYSNGNFTFDGEFWICENYRDVFSPVKAETIYYKLKALDTSVIEVTDNSQVGAGTAFID